jgi:pyridine nucleotide-disulfide oxidoreductase domain-containing protein 1
VKIILENDRVVGAVLMGKDEMENAETFENLILNRTDVKGIDLLNSQVDLADFFD